MADNSNPPAVECPNKQNSSLLLVTRKIIDPIPCGQFTYSNSDFSSCHDWTELANRVASDITYNVVIKFEVFVYVLRHANGSM